MSDLIKREAVLGVCIEEAHKAHRYKLGQTWELNYYEIEKAINSIPVAQPKVGKWTNLLMNDGWTCSVCGYDSPSRLYNYCPNCGAKMKETEIPEYPCISCCDLMERAACCGCDKETKWQAKYGEGKR